MVVRTRATCSVLSVFQEVKFALDRARYESKYDVKLVDSAKGDHQIEIRKDKSERAEKRLK
jgi:hypothetical protein